MSRIIKLCDTTDGKTLGWIRVKKTITNDDNLIQAYRDGKFAIVNNKDEATLIPVSHEGIFFLKKMYHIGKVGKLDHDTKASKEREALTDMAMNTAKIFKLYSPDYEQKHRAPVGWIKVNDFYRLTYCEYLYMAFDEGAVEVTADYNEASFLDIRLQKKLNNERGDYKGNYGRFEPDHIITAERKTQLLLATADEVLNDTPGRCYIDPNQPI